jgi:hypothetical protein
MYDCLFIQHRDGQLRAKRVDFNSWLGLHYSFTEYGFCQYSPSCTPSMPQLSLKGFIDIKDNRANTVIFHHTHEPAHHVLFVEMGI